LLEKTRVVAPGLGERNYHACYMLCKARRLSDGLQLPSAAELRYTGLTGCLDSPGWDDGAQLSLCEAAMTHVGVDAEAQGWLWRLLGALLLLGQLDFGEAEGLAEAQLAEPETLQTFCDLLQLDCEPMQRALQIKMTKAGAEWIAQPLLPAKASELRHGLARTMYSALFDFLVAQINRSLQIGEADTGRAAPPPLASSAVLERQASTAGRAKSMGGAKMRGSIQDNETSRLLSAMQARNERFIGILDIFGFETFKVNSLEQLCINFCNERLQAAFNESVFAAVQEENAAEGIVLPAADLSDVDNSEVVRLIGGKPGGILHSLNEECIVPKGSDASFLGKLMDLHKDSPLLKRPTREQASDALSFSVVHFVGPVVYSAHNLLMKNKDPVSQDLLVLLQHSRSPWVQSRFAGGGGSSGGGVSSGLTAPPGAGSRRKDTRFKGVAAKFQQQLEELLALVGFSDPHFVRCVKPNQKKAARLFEPVMVETQLLTLTLTPNPDP